MEKEATRLCRTIILLRRSQGYKYGGGAKFVFTMTYIFCLFYFIYLSLIIISLLSFSFLPKYYWLINGFLIIAMGFNNVFTCPLFTKIEANSVVKMPYSPRLQARGRGFYEYYVVSSLYYV